MTCVLGMVVRREREIREFVETPFYRVLSADRGERTDIRGRMARRRRAPAILNPLHLYKENGFKEKDKRRGAHSVFKRK